MDHNNSVDLQSQLKACKEAEQNRADHLDFMARMFSHNLRSPMAGMKMLFMLLDRTSGEERAEILHNLKESSGILFKMIDDLATILIDYRALSTDRKEFSVQEVIDEVALDIKDLLTDKQAILHAELEMKSFCYYREHLLIILKELITNALTHTGLKPGSRILIRSYLQDGHVVLSVEDSGIGIDLELFAKDLYKMYKPLQLESMDQNGIGLFRVKNIVEINGGKLTLNSEPDRGTQAVITLYHQDTIA